MPASEHLAALNTTRPTGAGIIAGAMKLLARALSKSIDGLGEKIEDNTTALDRNTEALNPTRPAARVVPLLLLLLLPMFLAGCPSTDPMIVRALERDRQIWEEDRREDLDPELIKSREAEFDAHERYAKAPK